VHHLPLDARRTDYTIAGTVYPTAARAERLQRRERAALTVVVTDKNGQ